MGSDAVSWMLPKAAALHSKSKSIKKRSTRCTVIEPVKRLLVKTPVAVVVVEVDSGIKL
jgi:hypothetical protein